MSRTRKALAYIDKSQRILEIGPAFAPIAPKSRGWNTSVVDTADQAELRTKYATHGLPLEDIEPVDFVWRGGPLHAAIPAPLHGTFDAVIASHVLEHVPDPIGLLLSLDRLLSRKGVISLVLPDKRFCADFFRPVTTSAAWIEAHERGDQRHSGRTLFEMHALGVRSRGRFSWGQECADELSFLATLQAAKDTASRAMPDPTGPYLDAHAWCFTPSTFELLVLEIGALGLVPLRVRRLLPTLGCEFFATLERAAPNAIDLDHHRKSLMISGIRELSEQATYLRRKPVRDILGKLYLVFDRANDAPFWRRTVRKLVRSALRSSS